MQPPPLNLFQRVPVDPPKRRRSALSLEPSAFSLRSQAFTILEMMIVIGIIGLLAAMALPHLKGFTTGSAMTAATRQLLDDVTLARQRAMANRSQVCMVFLPPQFWTNDYSGGYAPGTPANLQASNLYFHQYSAYALIALRSVGDQPGQSNVHYLTDWRFLPKGTFIAPFQFVVTNGGVGLTNLVSTTNTTTPPNGLSNGWLVPNLPTDIYFPFPSSYTVNLNQAVSNTLPYIGFLPNGQLRAGSDQFLALTSGSIFYSMNAAGAADFTSSPSVVETPPGNETNNANLIHIDWLTGRARIERNQF